MDDFQINVYKAKDVAAEVGNIKIKADRHGMGWTCEIDGEPVKRMRAVTLTLRVDCPNIVTVEIIPEHRKQEQKACTNPS